MRRACAITAGLLAALWLSAGSAFAFKETPEAPPPEGAQLIAPQTEAPAIEFQTTPPGMEQPEKSGAKVFSFGLLPKLDFGLELLYSQQPMELQQGAFPEENDDLTVLGKVKRRF